MPTVGKTHKRSYRKSRSRPRVSSTSVGKTRKRTHTKRRVSGTAAVGRTTPRKRRRSVGNTGGSLMKQVVPLAVGMAAGAAAQHFVLRPLEHKIAEKFPQGAKFFALGEVILGGYVALKAKNPIIKGAGLGIMAGGVHSGVKQLNLYRESPSVHGSGDYTTVHVPIDGQVRNMLNGIVKNQHGDTYTSMVAGSGGWDNERMRRTNMLAGIYGLDENGIGNEEDDYLQYKG